MSNFQVPEIEGVRVAHTQSNSDNRGTFVKFNPANGFTGALNSIAISVNPIPGTIRGLHFQLEPYTEEKLVTCIQGAVFDVVIDLRRDSKTFGKWAGIELSAANTRQIYLPKGVAHGFQTLVPNSIVHYGLGSPYSPEHSLSINPFAELGVTWPIEVTSISERDSSGVSFSFGVQKYAESLKR